MNKPSTTLITISYGRSSDQHRVPHTVETERRSHMISLGKATASSWTYTGPPAYAFTPPREGGSAPLARSPALSRGPGAPAWQRHRPFVRRRLRRPPPATAQPGTTAADAAKREAAVLLHVLLLRMRPHRRHHLLDRPCPRRPLPPASRRRRLRRRRHRRLPSAQQPSTCTLNCTPATRRCARSAAATSSIAPAAATL